MEWRRAGEEEEVPLEMPHTDQYELVLEDEWEGEELHSRHILTVVR